MLDDDGWQRPTSYSSKEEELAQVKKAGGLCDISPNGKLILLGEDLDALVALAFPDAGHLEVGRGAQCPAVDEKGAIIDQVLLCRPSDDEIYVITSPDKAQPVAGSLGLHVTGCTHLIDISSGLAAAKTLGPFSSQMLCKLTELDLDTERFPNLSCAQTSLAELYALIIRCDTMGRPSYEIYVERSYGEFMWSAMLEAGHGLGIGPVGIEALKLLRSEAQ